MPSRVITNNTFHEISVTRKNIFYKGSLVSMYLIVVCEIETLPRGHSGILGNKYLGKGVIHH